MSGQNVSATLSFDAETAIAKHLRVKHGTAVGDVAIAGDEASIGNAANAAISAGDAITVIDKRAPGTRTFVAGGAIAAGDSFTSAAGGKVVTGTGGAEDFGIALTATTADGEYFEGLIA
tara:strand:+ start:167 stop:523 length:357 start_codon:yes stop_codon:yes gene_type:complete